MIGWIVLATLCIPVAFGIVAVLCECCDTCTIFTDSFAADNISTDYTTHDGTWSVASGVLGVTSTTGLLTSDTASATGHGVVRVKMRTSVSGARGRVYGAFTDEDNCLFAEIHFNGGSSSFRVVEIIAGSQTVLGSGSNNFSTSTNTFYTVRMCWNSEIVVADLEASGPVEGVVSEHTRTGTLAGMGCGDNSSTVGFDDFEFLVHYADDTDCYSCESLVYQGACDPNTIRERIQVDITGVANSLCATCNDINTTYILNWFPDTTGGFYRFSDTECANTFVVTWKYQVTASESVLAINNPAASPEAAGGNGEVAPFDCFASWLGIALANQNPFGVGSQRCNYSAASADVTPL